MKISFITQNLAPFRVQWLDELGKYFDITIFHNGEYDRNINKQYIQNHSKRAREINIKKKFLGISIYQFHKIFKENDDILILDGYGFASQVMLILFLKLVRKKYILSVDGGFIQQNESILKRVLKRVLISNAAGYFSSSENTDKYLIYYGANRQKIMRHYLSSLYNEDIRHEEYNSIREQKYMRKYGVKSSNIIIGIGRFIYSKGFDVLLKSSEYIESDADIVIIGGEITDEYRSIMKQLSKADKIHIIPYCQKDMLLKLMDDSTIFVLPTRYDVWGLVINEAMARGLPVITTDMCGAGISLLENGKNGFIIKPNDEKELAEKINYLLNHKNILAQIYENNISKISEYTYKKIVQSDINHLKKYCRGMNIFE